MYTRRNQRHPKLNFMIDSRRFLHLWRNSSPSGIESHLEGQNNSLQSTLDFKLDAHILWIAPSLALCAIHATFLIDLSRI